jgi:Cytochrome P450
MQDTTIFISLWSLLHDEKAFEEPSKFKPERFLGPDGKFDKKNPNFINFGAGESMIKYKIFKGQSERDLFYLLSYQ